MIPCAFLLGSIPTGLLIARARGIDIRAHGSGNIGATNVTRVLGKKVGRICFGLDFLKGFIPAIAAGALFGSFTSLRLESATVGLWLAVAFAPVLGHVFCPWLKFKGGKGVATGVGALLGVFPVLTCAALLCVLVWVIVFKRTRIVGIASVLAALALPFAVGAAGAGLVSLGLSDGGIGAWLDVHGGWVYIGFGAGVAGFVTWTHRANIDRMRSGKEHAFASPGTGAARGALPSENGPR